MLFVFNLARSWGGVVAQKLHSRFLPGRQGFKIGEKSFPKKCILKETSDLKLVWCQRF